MYNVPDFYVITITIAEMFLIIATW